MCRTRSQATGLHLDRQPGSSREPGWEPVRAHAATAADTPGGDSGLRHDRHIKIAIQAAAPCRRATARAALACNVHFALVGIEHFIWPAPHGGGCVALRVVLLKGSVGRDDEVASTDLDGSGHRLLGRRPRHHQTCQHKQDERAGLHDDFLITSLSDCAWCKHGEGVSEGETLPWVRVRHRPEGETLL